MSVPTPGSKGTVGEVALRMELAGAVVDVRLRTMIELGDRIERWERNGTMALYTRDPPAAWGLREAGRGALQEYKSGSLAVLVVRVQNFARDFNLEPYLSQELHRARVETFEEVVALEGAEKAAALFRAIGVPVPAERSDL